MTQIRVPDGLWDTAKIPEAVLSQWLYLDGATVTEGSVVAVVMAEKTEFEIQAPADGTLRITVPADGVVAPGGVIGKID